ncbi:PAS domain S-box protein [Azohydromonas aeria]|uniref:PAS domain S-box protein n=1 Tax=Azohydromonas aeria TaxID=2590212 RepID=UPI0018E05CE0|nr:PAS domain S-box protein [Azohydromonas aeria]
MLTMSRLKQLLAGPRRLVLALWLLALALSMLAGWRVELHNEAVREARLQALVDDKVEFIQRRFLRYEGVLRGTLGTVLAVDPGRLTREQFEAALSVRDLPREFPGVQGLGFIRRVPRDQEAGFLQRARADGAPGFVLRPLAPHDGERFVVQYMYPRATNAGTEGVDAAGNIERREAALEAMRSGEPRMTAPVTLVQVPEALKGSLMLLMPVYRGPEPLHTPAQRQAQATGWIIAPVVAANALRDEGLGQDEFTYTLTDRASATRFYASAGGAGDIEPGTGVPHVTRQLSLYGRTWQLQAQGLPRLAAADVLVSGTRLSAALALLCTLTAFAAFPLLRTREHRLQLQHEAERFAAGIVDASPQALLVVDEQGSIVRANQAAAELFGYPLAELNGLCVDRLVGAAHAHDHARWRQGYDGQLRSLVSRPGLGARRRDGSEFTVALSLNPLQLGGQRFVVASVADVTAQQQAIEVLRRSERRWQEMTHLLPGIVWSCDAQGAPEFVNRRWQDYTGQRADPVPTQAQWLEAVHPDDHAEVVAAWQHAVESCTAYYIEYRLRRHDGAWRWFEVHAVPLLSDQGQALRWIGAYNDIHDRRQAQEELRLALQHEEQRVAERTAELRRTQRDLHNILDALPSLVSYWDRGLINRFANAAVRQWLGLEPHARQRPHLREVLGETLYAQSLPYAQAALRGEPQRFERSFPRPDGQGLRHSVTYYLPDVVDGEVRGFYSLVHDVTEIVESRRALDAERQRLDDILRDTRVATWEWNVQTGEARFNERWAEIVGHRLEELQPVSFATWERLVHPEDLKRSGELLQRHFRGEVGHYECEVRMRHREGQWVWVRTSGRVNTRGEDSQPQWMHGIHQDVTPAREAQQALAASKAFLERVSRVSGVGGWQVDLRSGEVQWSAEMHRITGVAPGRMLGIEQGLSRYPGQALQQVAAAVRAAVEQGRPYELEVPYTTEDGRSIWVRTVGEPEYDPTEPHAAPVRLVGTLQDVTERHAAATALVDARHAAEAANAAKSDFLANMSHEIRTPLNAVIGLAYLLEQSALDARQRDSVAKIQVASRTLLAVIDDVLDLAKIEAREIALESRTFDARALLQDLRHLFAEQAQAKGLALEIEPAPPTLELLVGDDTRLRQILVNLLGNAIKFTESGVVALRLRAESAGSRRVRLHCTVQDTGVGIPLDAQKRLFSPFTQADTSTTRRFGGTGLGLSIVKKLSELMGGSVAVVSEPGQGSQFFVTVELGLGARPGEEDSGLQVAVVAQQPERRETLLAMCRAMGWRAANVSPGQASAQLQGSPGRDTLADVLVVDAPAGASPSDNAQALVAEALAVHAINGKPVVLLSGQAPEAVTTTDAALRPHGRLAWPVSTSSLFDTVTQAMTRHWAGADRAALSRTPLPAGSRALPGVRVLVVDDSHINREVATRILELQGAVVSSAGDGVQALQWLREHCDACDVVLMDVQMPLMDGLEATRRLRADLGLAQLPVLALTAGALVSERERARAAGMDDFLSKPLEPQALVRSVRWHVERAQGKPLPYEAQPAATLTVKQPRHVEPAPRAESEHSWPQVAGINIPAAAQCMGYDLPFFKSLLATLLRDTADLASEDGVRRQFDAGVAAFAARMHRVRGSAAMLGIESLEVVAQALESSADAGTLTDSEVQVLGVDLVAALEELRLAYAALEPDPQPEAAGPAAPMERSDVDAFIALLSRQSLDAEAMFDKFTPQLRAALGAGGFEQLREAMHGLEFRAARAIVEGRLPACG